MHLEVTFKNLRPRDEIRNRAEALYLKLERFLEPASEGHLRVGIDHGAPLLELVVTAHGEVHKATEAHEDLRTALDKLFHNIENQLRRTKERRLDGRTDVRMPDGFGVQDGFGVPDGLDVADGLDVPDAPAPVDGARI